MKELVIDANTNSFADLYLKWQKVLNTKELNKSFFKKNANLYFWSVAKSQFPYQYLKKDAKNEQKSDAQLQELANQKATIIFITRMIFVWFLKEKKLIPSHLFDNKYIDSLLNKSDNESYEYYNAILQNLFFATLNRPKDNREFATDKGFLINKTIDFDQNSLYRFETLFKDEDSKPIMALFESIPFLNGGLFDSLDSIENDERAYILR